MAIGGIIDGVDKADLLQAIQAFGGGVGGFLRTVRPDDRFPTPAIVGPCSPGIEPFFRDLKARGLTPTGRRIEDGKLKIDIRVDKAQEIDVTALAKLIKSSQVAAMTAAGRQAIMHARNVAEERMIGLHRDLSEFDAKEMEEISFSVMLDVARRTLGNTLYECGHPEPDANPSQIAGRLSEAMHLGWLCRVLEDHIHDWNLGGRGDTLRTVYERFHDAERRQRIRGGPRDDVLSNLGRRLEADVRYLREMERRLRATLRNPCRLDYDYDSFRPEALVEACFDAALNLEANYESRVFDDPSPSV